MIGCFYDAALRDAREVSGDMVVTAPCAASLEIAASLANRFGIIVGRRKRVNQMNATVRDNGMAERLSGFYAVEFGVNDFQTDHDVTEQLLTEAGQEAIEGRLRQGDHPRMHPRDRVSRPPSAGSRPSRDRSVNCSAERAQYAAELKRKCGWKPSRRSSCEPPPEEEIAAFGIIGDGDVFGNRVVVGAR